jgi:ParB/RepB/Spo0J family partition protein
MTTQTDSFATLPLSAIVPSHTNPRKSFNPAKLQELATSIATSGVHQPILVRPLPAARLADTSTIKPRPAYELVAGERRYRASKLAGVDTIPTLVRTLSDEQVLEIQIVENLQRDDLSDLEAAEGYQTLMDHNHISAEQVADRIGKSRTFVYNSLKLLKLSPDAKTALRAEQIKASIGQLIARIPNDALQAKALAHALQPDGDGDKPSYRSFSQWLQRNVMLNLDIALFKIADATLCPAAGACTSCTKRTGANPDLFTDVKAADLCIDPPCFNAKMDAQRAVWANENDDDDDGDSDGNDYDDNEGSTPATREQARLAQAARDKAAADPFNRLNKNIERLKDRAAVETDKAQRLACADACIDYIYGQPADRTSLLITAELFRAWLPLQLDDFDHMAMTFDLPPLNTEGDWQVRNAAQEAYEEQCRLRIQRASDEDIYRYAAAFLILPDREVYTSNAEHIKPATLFDAFAKSQNLDLVPVRQEAANLVEDDTAEELAKLNAELKAISKAAKTAKDEKKAAKKSKSAAAETTSTPPPAGAAIDTGEAALKTGAKTKPAALPRKAKTSTEEAKAGIAAAMQGLSSEPLDASLGGSEAASIKVGAVVNVLDGKHKGKAGTITSEVGADMWNVSIYSAVGLPFSTYLPTKSIEVSA